MKLYDSLSVTIPTNPKISIIKKGCKNNPFIKFMYYNVR